MVALDLSSLNRAVLQLQQGLAEARNAPGDELRRDGVNQRFGCSYERSVKMLRRYIELTSASPGRVDAMGFPDLIRAAAEQGLLSGGWPAWRDYRAARGTTSHTYDADKARRVCGHSRVPRGSTASARATRREDDTAVTGLTATELAIVREILERFLPGRDVVAFGSRARGGHKPTSDLDLAVLGDSPMSLSERAAVEEAFSESDLPMKVDLVDWATADASFRRLIERDAVPIRHPGDHRWRKA